MTHQGITAARRGEVIPVINGALQAAEKFGNGQERRTSGAKVRRILNHLRPD